MKKTIKGIFRIGNKGYLKRSGDGYEVYDSNDRHLGRARFWVQAVALINAQ